MKRETETTILIILGFLTVAVSGGVIGWALAEDSYRTEAITHDAAQWVISDPMQGTTEFVWK